MTHLSAGTSAQMPAVGLMPDGGTIQLHQRLLAPLGISESAARTAMPGRDMVRPVCRIQ